MLYAIDQNDDKVLPIKSGEHRCPVCLSKVVAKIGSINAPHWSHLVKSDCPSSKAETEWHLTWKSLFFSSKVEIRKGKHVADVLLDGDTAIEFQHSSISVGDIESRNNNYKRIIWVVNGDTIGGEFLLSRKDYGHTFKFKRRKKSWSYMNNLYIDFGSYIFVVKKEYDEMKSGWGKIISKDEFLKTFAGQKNTHVLLD